MSESELSSLPPRFKMYDAIGSVADNRVPLVSVSEKGLFEEEIVEANVFSSG